MNLPPLALYVHLPWCVRKCPYCDFNSHQLKSAQPDGAYIDALLRDFELEWPQAAGRRIDSIFFGGGTPSLFSPQELQKLLDGVRGIAPLAEDVEITLEANPGAIEHGAFAGYARAGINRISLGAQSFSPAALQALGRIHAAGDTVDAVRELRAAGFSNFNLDLMYALPGQVPAGALDDLRRALDLGPSHLSHYQLTLEPGTVFATRPPSLPDEDAAYEMQIQSQQMLAHAGFEQYETSAYAHQGARCRHNLNYWRFGDYIGIGAGAHGKLTLPNEVAARVSLPPGTILRTAKPKQPRDYQQQACVAQAPFGERVPVPRGELPFEYMLNALRLNEGFDRAEFEARTGLSIEDIRAPLGRAEARQLLQRTSVGFRPTALGRQFLNDLQGEFLA